MYALNETKLTPYAQQVKDGTTLVSDKRFSPGYFDYEGQLARRREHGQRAEVWKGGTWALVPIMAHFLHEATDLSKPISVKNRPKPAPPAKVSKARFKQRVRNQRGARRHGLAPLFNSTY